MAWRHIVNFILPVTGPLAPVADLLDQDVVMSPPMPTIKAMSMPHGVKATLWCCRLAVKR